MASFIRAYGANFVGIDIRTYFDSYAVLADKSDSMNFGGRSLQILAHVEWNERSVEVAEKAREALGIAFENKQIDEDLSVSVNRYNLLAYGGGASGDLAKQNAIMQKAYPFYDLKL